MWYIEFFNGIEEKCNKNSWLVDESVAFFENLLVYETIVYAQHRSFENRFYAGIKKLNALEVS